MRSQADGGIDRGGAVRAADDADSARFGGREAQQAGENKHDKDAQLRRRAQQQRLGVGEQGAEIGARAYAQEDQTGINAQLDAQIQIIQQAGGNRGHHAADLDLFASGQRRPVHVTAREQLFMIEVRARQVG